MKDVGCLPYFRHGRSLLAILALRVPTAVCVFLRILLLVVRESNILSANVRPHIRQVSERR
jgi:hypothetical protein